MSPPILSARPSLPWTVESIGAFLPLSDLCLLVRLSRTWQGVASKIRTRAHRIRIKSKEMLNQVVTWSHRRWIGRFEQYSPQLHFDDLELIRNQMSQVHALVGVIDMDAISVDASCHRLLPFGSLRSLHIELWTATHWDDDEDQSVPLADEWMIARMFMESVATITTLEELILELDGPLKSGEAVPIQLLERLPKIRNSLETLSISRTTHYASFTYDQPHVDIIRQMSALTYLNMCGRWSPKQLGWLVAEPNPIGSVVRELDLSWTVITDDHATPLSKLTGLTTLESEQFTLVDASFLGHLKQLKTLQLWCKPPKLVQADSIIQGVSRCVQIECLHFRHATMTDEQLSLILRSLTKLRSLTLLHMKALVSCACLHHAHLSVTLKELILSGCSSLSLTAFDSALKQLRSLESVWRDGAPVKVTTVKDVQKNSLASV